MIALPSKTIAILIGTMAVVGALTTTCARLEFGRRRFESTLELDRRKFEHEQARLLFDRDERTLELERRTFEHEQARLLFDRDESALELERRKFEHEQARLLFDREKLDARKITLNDSARKRAEHELLRISSKKVGSVDRAFTHIDASVFIQNVFDEFVAIGFIED